MFPPLAYLALIFSFPCLISSRCLVTRNYARFRRALKEAGVVNNRVVDGTPAHFRYPFIVSIHRRGYFVGGGLIIDRHWILSAAHLFTAPKGSGKLDLTHFRIGYGSNQLSGQSFTTIDAIHPHYHFSSTTLQDDIALLHSPSPLLIRNRTSPIYLPYPPKRPPLEPNSLTILGWGDLGEGRANLGAGLMQGQMRAISRRRCGKFFKHPIAERQICLFFNDPDKRVGACLGDSGGPAFELLSGKPILVGISSWTDLHCSTYYPSVFTRVSHYLEWICSTVRHFEGGQK